MAHLLRIDSSLRGEGLFSRSVADTFQNAWQQARPDGTVTLRELGRDPLPYLTWEAYIARSVPEAERTPEQQEAAARSAALVDELLAADTILLAVPLYNWGTPAPVKTWFDYLFSDPRTRDPEGLLRGRQAVLVNARGGSYQPGTPREGWDHAEPYLRRVLADVLGLDLLVITPELTLADVNPALAQFIDRHRVSLAEAHGTAATAGRELVGQCAA